MVKQLRFIHLALGAALIFSGVFVLMNVRQAQAEEVQTLNSFQLSNCVRCPAEEIPLTVNSPDPCKACHNPNNQAIRLLTEEEQAALEQELSTLQARILSFGNQATAFQKHDERYQSALESWWDAQSATRLGSAEQAYALIAQANEQLGQLENEDASGFWTSSKERPIHCSHIAPSSITHTPSIHTGYGVRLSIDLEPTSIDNDLVVDIPLRRMLAIHRRGPPAEAFMLHIDFEMNRRLLFATRSPFYLRVLADMRGFETRKETSLNSRENTDCEHTVGNAQGAVQLSINSLLSAVWSVGNGQRYGFSSLSLVPVSVNYSEKG